MILILIVYFSVRQKFCQYFSLCDLFCLNLTTELLNEIQQPRILKETVWPLVNLVFYQGEAGIGILVKSGHQHVADLINVDITFIQSNQIDI